MRYPHRMPVWLDKAFPDYTWIQAGIEKNIYLTFDDGPIPEVTPWVLDVLNEENVKASFFWVGSNVERYPSIAQEVFSQGHTIGNHSHTHLKGWNTAVERYVKDVLHAQRVIEDHIGESPKYFRPPYGRIRSSQSKVLRANNFEIIMWSVLSWDFEARLKPSIIQDRTRNATFPGSIVVFHDSIKAAPQMQAVLKDYIHWGVDQGYNFLPL